MKKLNMVEFKDFIKNILLGLGGLTINEIEDGDVMLLDIWFKKTSFRNITVNLTINRGGFIEAII